MKPESPIPSLTALLLLSIAVLSMAFSSCAPRAVIVEPIAPKAAHLKATTDATTTAAKRVTASVAAVTNQTTDLRSDLVKAMLEASRIQKAGLATQAELDDNAARWQAVSIKAGLLGALTQSATIDAKELTQAASAASAEAGDMVQTSIQLDAGVQTLKTELVEQAPNAALGAQLKRTGWILFWLIVFGIVVFAAIKISPYVIKACKTAVIP